MSGHIWNLIKNLSNVMKKIHEFCQQYPNKPKFVPHRICHYRGNDAINVNAMEFIHMSVHP